MSSLGKVLLISTSYCVFKAIIYESQNRKFQKMFDFYKNVPFFNMKEHTLKSFFIQHITLTRALLDENWGFQEWKSRSQQPNNRLLGDWIKRILVFQDSHGRSRRAFPLSRSVFMLLGPVLSIKVTWIRNIPSSV
jgi:hypothetical protein